MKKSTPPTKGQAIIIAIILVTTISVVLFVECSPNSIRINSEIIKPSFTIQLPRSFYEDNEGDFIFGGDDYMYVTFAYADNEIMLDTECFALLYESSFHDINDIVSREKVIINGTEAWQMVYNTVTTANDETQNYYAGVFTVFPLGNEFLVVDAYECLADINSDYSPISDRNIKLLKDITATIQITNTKYDNKVVEAKELYASELKLSNTSNWDIEEDVVYGYVDYGYFVSYRFRKLKMWINIYEYNDENAMDLHDILIARTKDSTYTSMGEGFILGEKALLFSYNAFAEDNGPPYLYGAVAISEHYAIDMHFNLYTNEYSLPYDTARSILNDLLKAEYK